MTSGEIKRLARSLGYGTASLQSIAPGRYALLLKRQRYPYIVELSDTDFSLQPAEMEALIRDRVKPLGAYLAAHR